MNSSIGWYDRREHGGIIVSALDSGSNDPGSSPGVDTTLCVLGQGSTFIMPLFSSPVYKNNSGYREISLILEGNPVMY